MKEIRKIRAEDFDGVNFVSLKDDVEFVYMGFDENDDESCYVGCEYEDSTFSVIGLGVDKFCDCDEMIRIILSGF